MAMRSRARRALLAVEGVLVVVLSLAAGAAAVNRHFGYYPTVGTLFGHVSPDQVAAPVVSLTPASAPTASWSPPARGVVEHVRIPGVLSGFRARRAWVY